jgi:cytochrome c oxidase subunit 2
VRRTRWTRGAGLVVLVGAVTLLLSGCSVSGAERDLRFGWPTGVTKQATEMRVLWTWSSVAALVVGIIVWGLIFWACGRYRKKSDVLPRQTKYNLPLEIAYSIVPFLIIAGLFYRTVVVEDDVNKLTAHPDVNVQVDAFKWNWQFEYSAIAGQKQTYPGTQQTPSTVGSTTEIPILVIPVGQTVRILEHSEDVIHSFWVPEFLFKRDVIPHGTDDTSRDNQFEFTATSTGRFVGRCAELCGTYHSEMNFEVRVVSPSDFKAYVAALTKLGPSDPTRQSEALKAIGEAPCATTTHPFNTDRTDRKASPNTVCEGV